MTGFWRGLEDFAPVWASAMWRAIWQGGLTLAAVWILCWAFPKIPARVRCWCWRLAFAKVLVCLFWATPVKLALLPAEKSWLPVAAKAALTQTPTPVDSRAPIQASHNSAMVVVARNGTWLHRLDMLLLALWTVGVITGTLGIASHWRSARILILRSRKFNHGQIETTLRLLSADFGIRSPPDIRMGENLKTPLLAGLRKPTILVPSAFLNDKSPEQLRMMIAHELAHIKRRDLWWSWLTMLAQALFFFYPLVLLARKESHLVEEMAADELAVTVCRLKPVDYAGMLVEIAARSFQPQIGELIVGIVGSHQTLKRRLQAMKQIHLRSNQRMTAVATIITIVGLSAIVPWKVTAQEPKSGGGIGAMETSAKNRVTVRMDDEGHYNYAGHPVGLDEIIAEVRNAAEANPTASLAIQATPRAPFDKLAELFKKLNETGISRVSLVTLTQDEAYGHRVPASFHGSSKPQIFDIDFGVAPSKQTGPAAAGGEGDFWNAGSVAWNNDHTESGMKFASGEPSPIQVRMINLGGGWGSGGRMGVKAPMLDAYNYPVNNQGGNSQVILKAVPPGTYDLYIYGHEADPLAYGDYTLTVGHHNYGRKATSNKNDAIENTSWVEGSQYVKYSNVEIGAKDDVDILIQPGGQVTDHWGRTFSDAVICGLQLIPAQ